MSILNSIWNLIKSVFKKLLSFISKILKDLWPLLLICAVIWFAAPIAGYLTSIGAPQFLVTAIETLGMATPMLTSAVTWLTTGVGSLATSAWASYASLELGTQLMIATGVAAAIAPDETSALITDVAHTVTDVVGDVASGVSDSLFGGNFWLYAALGVGAYLLITSRKDNNA